MQNIEFSFNYSKNIFHLHFNYMLEQNIKHNKTIETIITEECLKNEECIKNNIILKEENIVLYDIHNNYRINSVNDLLKYKTDKCKIIIIPLNCCNH